MNFNFNAGLAVLTILSGCVSMGLEARPAAAQNEQPAPTSVDGRVATYGDRDLLGFQYPPGADPTAGARMIGLKPGAVSLAAQGYDHGWPITPGTNNPAGSQDYPNTDQIFVGSNQTGQHDGYAEFDGRKQGPALFRLDYSQLVPAGARIQTLTLGIAADDFQFPVWGQPFSATVNGQPNDALTRELNSINETGPDTRYLSVGIDPAILASNHVLTVSIDEGGDGGDGFAIDFLTVGVTTSAEASTSGGDTATPLRQSASSSGAITTTATVLIQDESGVEIHLKQQEKIAAMFMEAIFFLEDDCRLHMSRYCSLGELVAGPKSPGWNVGRLKYDPARDTNYKYTVTLTAHGWNASATPERPGLGGFFYDLDHGIIVDRYYNPNGPASAEDKKLGETSESGEIFQVQ